MLKNPLGPRRTIVRPNLAVIVNERKQLMPRNVGQSVQCDRILRISRILAQQSVLLKPGPLLNLIRRGGIAVHLFLQKLNWAAWQTRQK